jgi:hypothetical protein
MTLKNIIAFTTSLMLLPVILPLTTVASGTGSGDSANTDDHGRPLLLTDRNLLSGEPA